MLNLVVCSRLKKVYAYFGIPNKQSLLLLIFAIIINRLKHFEQNCMKSGHRFLILYMLLEASKH